MNDNQEVKIGMTDGDDSQELHPSCMRAFDGWISVHDMTPPKEMCVDIWFDYSDGAGRLCNCFYNSENDEFWYWGENDGEKVEFDAGLVTHWRPLPPTPVK